MRIGLSKKRGTFNKLLLVAVIFICLLGIFMYRLIPVFIVQLTCHANTIVTDRVNKTIYRVLEDTDRYERISENSAGRASYMTADMARINRIKAKAVVEVQDELNNIASDAVYIPLMSVLKMPLFSGTGIKIPIQVVPMTTVDADYSEKFYSAGINQSIYELNMNIIVNVSYCGFAFNKTDTINTEIPIIKTVINGDTPEYYGILSGTDAELN